MLATVNGMPYVAPNVWIPLVCFGLLILAVIYLLLKFFVLMHRSDKESDEKQDALYKSRFLKKVARSQDANTVLPKAYGRSSWKSWLK